MDLKPLGDRVVIELVEEEATTASGIVLPDSAKEKPMKGTVVAVGPGRWDEDGERQIPVGVEVGQQVLYSQFGGTEVEIDGTEYLILKESDLLAVWDRSAVTA